MHLDTDRLLVRDLQESDLDAVHEILDLDLWQPGRSRAERARWLNWTVLDYEQRRLAHQPPYGDYAIVLKHTNQLVGLVGLVPTMMPFALLEQYPRNPWDEAHSFNLPEVGLFWGVSSRHQRQGFATEAGAAMVAYGFGDWNLRRIVATTEHDNTASIGVMRRLGMQIARNPAPTPFFLAVVGILENPNPPPSWQEWTAPPPFAPPDPA
jgi:[ribosomal protein S5]-alanine N-acetyltransferase